MKGHRVRMCLWPVLVIAARQRVRKYAALRAVCYPNLFGAGGWSNDGRWGTIRDGTDPSRIRVEVASLEIDTTVRLQTLTMVNVIMW